MSLKPFSLALILSVFFHGVMSQGLGFKLPRQSLSPKPQFIFLGSILKSSDIREIKFEAPASVVSSVSLEPLIEKNDATGSAFTLEKPVSGKVRTEKENLKSPFEIVDIKPQSQPQTPDTFEDDVRAYKPLQFP